jgi:hypothetical protein
LFDITILPYEEVHYCVRPVRAGFSLEEITTLTLEWQKSDGTTTTTVAFDAIVDGAAYSSIVNSLAYENDIGRAHLNFLPIDIFRDGDTVTVKGTGLLTPKTRRDLEESEQATPSMNADGGRRLQASTPAKFATLLQVDSTGIDEGSSLSVTIIVCIVVSVVLSVVGCLLCCCCPGCGFGKKKRRREEEEEDEARRRHPEYPEMDKYGRKLSSTSSESV